MKEIENTNKSRSQIEMTTNDALSIYGTSLNHESSDKKVENLINNIEIAINHENINNLNYNSNPLNYANGNLLDTSQFQEQIENRVNDEKIQTNKKLNLTENTSSKYISTGNVSFNENSKQNINNKIIHVLHTQLDTNISDTTKEIIESLNPSNSFNIPNSSNSSNSFNTFNTSNSSTFLPILQPTNLTTNSSIFNPSSDNVNNNSSNKLQYTNDNALIPSFEMNVSVQSAIPPVNHSIENNSIMNDFIIKTRTYVLI